MSNAYLKQRQEKEQYIFDQGAAIGFQRCLDYMQVILRDPEYVGKDIFGRNRWELLYKGLQDCDKTYGDAFTMGVNADYCQEKLDAVIRDIFGDDALSFAERYPMVKAQTYNKPKRGWV